MMQTASNRPSLFCRCGYNCTASLAEAWMTIGLVLMLLYINWRDHHS